ADSDHPRKISEAFLDALVRLHAVDASADDIRQVGKPEGYVERQVRGWADRWERAKTQEIAEMDEVVRWLAAAMPEPLAPTLIHNDYKLDNTRLSPAEPVRLTAVLDWEMATIGDPLSDLGLTLCYWLWATDPEVRAAGIPALTQQPGWYTRDEL